jgi:hypothetical protein
LVQQLLVQSDLISDLVISVLNSAKPVAESGKTLESKRQTGG